MKKITGFACILAQTQNQISYTYNELDDNGNILKANIRKSYTVKDNDTGLATNISEVINFLETTINI